MLTKNFYALMRAGLGLANGSVISENNEKKIARYDSKWWNGVFTKMNNYENTTSSQNVEFGNGTTPATVNDYKLENKITTGISVAYPSSVTTEYTDSYILWTVTFGITASVETTISEIGLTSIATIGDGGLSATVLVDRTVLDEPITIPAGQSKQITYTIRFNYGDAV